MVFLPKLNIQMYIPNMQICTYKATPLLYVFPSYFKFIQLSLWKIIAAGYV